jgi:hypothetical protein
MIKLTPTTMITVDAAAAEGLPRRSISGVAVTYDETATVADGTQVRFKQGSLPVEGKNPKLYMQHDSTQIIGQVVERVDTPQGMMFTARISDTALGRDALTMAKDGTLDAVSVGVSPTKFSYDEAGVMVIEAANWDELSLVSIGAFAGATITQVAASIPQPEPEIDVISDQDTNKDETTMSDTLETPKETSIVEAAKATAEKLFAQPKREPRLPNASEFVAAMHAGGEIAANANRVWADYREYHKSPITAAAGDEVLSNMPGIIPTPILAPVFESLNYIAPVLNALGTRAMPNGGSGATFIRPTWTTHPSVAQQATELTAVSATTAVIAANTVTKVTFAGSAQMSYQLIDFSDPAAMQIVLRDLAGQYLLAIDNYAADNLLTAASSSGVWDLTPEDLMKSIYDAAVDVSNATNFLPTHMFVDPATWGKIGQLVDDSKRPIFPAIGAPGLVGQNSMGAGSAASWSGQNPLGLQIVVDKNFAAKTMIIMNANAFEVYRQDRGLLSVESPTTLGRTMSIFGYAATFAAGENFSMIRKITQA